MTPKNKILKAGSNPASPRIKITKERMDSIKMREEEAKSLIKECLQKGEGLGYILPKQVYLVVTTEKVCGIDIWGIPKIKIEVNTLHEWSEHMLRDFIMHEVTHLVVPDHSKKFWEVYSKLSD